MISTNLVKNAFFGPFLKSIRSFCAKKSEKCPRSKWAQKNSKNLANKYQMFKQKRRRKNLRKCEKIYLRRGKGGCASINNFGVMGSEAEVIVHLVIYHCHEGLCVPFHVFILGEIKFHEIKKNVYQVKTLFLVLELILPLFSPPGFKTLDRLEKVVTLLFNPTLNENA